MPVFVLNTNPFIFQLQILRSEDFGLFLTNTDTEEIMQYFIKYVLPFIEYFIS